MAVFTKLSKDDIKTILLNYNIGNLTDYQAIEKGVENSNFFLNTDQGKFVLTIFEKKLYKPDLPFFLQLIEHLNKNNFPAPKIFRNNKDHLDFNFKAKTGIIISFLTGSLAEETEINPIIMFNLGKMLAKFHQITQSFSKKRENQYGVFQLIKLKQKLKLKKAISEQELGLIEYFFTRISQLDLSNIRKSIIHADLFPDNVFITNNEISGLIDFYFACEDYLMLDIAIIINSWCFDKNQNINLNFLNNFIKGYQTITILDKNEKENLHNFCIIAALRFYLSRVADKLEYKKDDLVTAKDPNEYFKILEFYNKNKITI